MCDNHDLASVAIVGAGSIGVSFAVLFAAAGIPVRVYDNAPGQLASVAARVRGALADLAEYDLLDDDSDRVQARVSVHDDLPGVLEGACYVQECVVEDLEVKRALFSELDTLAHQDAVLASASSAIMASEFAAGLPGAARCLVAHPGNPPLMIRVIELVPAPFTGAAAVDAAAALLGRAGLSVVRLQKEIKGFVFNRLQGALLREAYCLVRDGVAQVEDIDRLVRDGLGLRWSVIGPFETADLNRRGGIAGHAAIMGEAYAAMGAERGQNDPWTPELVAKVDAERRALLPLEHWDERVHWRDRQLMKALAAKRAGE